MSAIASQTHARPGNAAGKSSPRFEAALASFGLDAALARARRHLLSLQKSDGHWVGELQGDTILESETVMLLAFLGLDGDDRIRKAANYLVEQQRSQGAWSNYPGGPVDLNVSVKAYFALKLAGHDPEAPHMHRARQAILAQGGAINCNSYTKFYLALLGQFPYDNCAAVPPEMLFLPKWAYINVYAFSAWTRTIVIPLSLFFSHKPVRQLPPERGCAELFVEHPFKAQWPHPPTKRIFTATNFFLAVDQVIKWLEKWGPQVVRRKAIDKAHQWMLDHFDDSDGVGAIYPPIVYTIISLRCLGYADDSPEMVYARKQLDDLAIEEGDTLRYQPCFSPVWDTALSLNALAMAGSGGHDAAMAKAAHWLVEREVRRPGDWSLLNPDLEPSGWYFEYRNSLYPDSDDTSMVLMGLARSGYAWERSSTGEKRLIPAAERGIAWMLGMQNQDGGWAAFDRDINREILNKVPFADHNAMLDPSCPDITARVLEALGQYGYRCDHPQVQKALHFIERTQDKRGCWIGRWGVNYIYGTWQVLVGLEAIGYDPNLPMVRRAVDWLKSVQQPCGGWGETCATYDDPHLAGTGPVTASQTAWALLGLISAGEGRCDAVEQGVRHLIATQQPDGNWREDEFTGTGFPKVFYLKYHLYRLYFPLMALARAKQALATPPRTVHYDWKPDAMPRSERVAAGERV